jgi:hypothetical protein
MCEEGDEFGRSECHIFNFFVFETLKTTTSEITDTNILLEGNPRDL